MALISRRTTRSGFPKVDCEPVSWDESSLPFYRFWGGYLRSAVKDLYRPIVNGRRSTIPGIITKPRLWCESEANDFGLFVWVCELLGINYKYARKEVLTNTKKKFRTPEVRKRKSSIRK
jgi:hypothetical protein